MFTIAHCEYFPLRIIRGIKDDADARASVPVGRAKAFQTEADPLSTPPTRRHLGLADCCRARKTDNVDLVLALNERC